MRTLLSAIICLFLFGCISGQTKLAKHDPLQLTTIGGTISADLILDGNYLLIADLQVPADISLTIEPGTTIYVQPSESTKIDPEFLSRETEILIRGSLQAVGTKISPIKFKPLTDDPNAILWSGLQLVNPEQVQLAHVIIEQAEAGVLCLNASPQISSLQVHRSRYGVLLQQQSAPRISDSLFVNGQAGLFCWDQSAPRIQNSSFSNLQEEGVYLGRECQGSFSDNLIEGNDRGVVLPENISFAPSNRVIGNRIDFHRYPQEAK